MVLTPTIQSKWRLDVEIATVYTQVRAISSFTPAVNPTIQDASDYDSAGWGSDARTLRKWENTMTVMRKEDTTGYDPGQEFLRAAANAGDLVTCRWYERDVADGEAYSGSALVVWEPQGGDTTILSTVNVRLLGQGARTTITHPGAPTVAPTITSVTPATVGTAGGDLILISGAGFTGATAVTEDGNAMTDFDVVSDSRISAVVPADTAGSYDLVVTTPGGSATLTGGLTYA